MHKEKEMKILEVVIKNVKGGSFLQIKTFVFIDFYICVIIIL